MRPIGFVVGMAACVIMSASARAGTTRYYYDPVGRLQGAMQTNGTARTSTSDKADNPSALQVISLLKPTGQDTLPMYGGLIEGQGLTSQNGQYTASVTQDGHFVVMNGSTEVGRVPDNQTVSQPGYFYVSASGDLILYGPDGSTLYDAQQSPGSGSTLVMQNTGCLAAFDGGTKYWSLNNC